MQLLLLSLGATAFFLPSTPAPAQACANEQARTGLSAGLPDCRAYELVSPAQKNGQLTFAPGIFNDSQISLSSLGAFDGAPDDIGAEGSYYMATRNATEWQSTPIDPPAVDYEGTGNLNRKLDAVSSDFTRALFTETPVGANEEDQRFYLRGATGGLTEVGPALSPALLSTFEPNSSSDAPAFGVVGTSEDLSHVAFSLAGKGQSNYFWPGDSTEPIENVRSLYEYVGTRNAAPQLVGVNNEGKQIGRCGDALGNDPFDTYHAISETGRIIYFTVFAGCQEVPQPPAVTELYARVEGPSGPGTVDISEPTLPNGAECTAGHACFGAAHAPGEFQGASRDGRRVFVLTEQSLLNSDEDSTQDLYEEELVSEGRAAHVGRITQISEGASSDPTPGSGANVLGVSRVSETGSRVYFVATGVLTTAANAEGQVAEAGGHNLYVYEPDPSDPNKTTVKFVAQLSPSDEADWRLEDSRPLQATPDGRFLVFRSVGSLTADCPASTCKGFQLYRYDAQTATLERISKGQNGFNANGTTALVDLLAAPGYSGTNALTGPKPGSMSADGQYIVFASSTALTPQALEDPNFELFNIYEFHDGQVYLISDGHDRQKVLGSSATTLIGISPSGANIYFTSADQLVPEDGDTQRDVYDARIDGGFSPRAVQEPCVGEACQNQPTTAAAASTPASLSYFGPGNLAASAPVPVPSPKPKVAPTRAQKLAKALAACSRKPKRRRVKCRAEAHKRYGHRPAGHSKA